MVTVGIISGMAEGEAGGVALRLESSGGPKATGTKAQLPRPRCETGCTAKLVKSRLGSWDANMRLKGSI